MWERMEKLSKGQPPEWLSTHPRHGSRTADLQAAMPEALRDYDRTPHAPAPNLSAIGK